MDFSCYMTTWIRGQDPQLWHKVRQRRWGRINSSSSEALKTIQYVIKSEDIWNHVRRYKQSLVVGGLERTGCWQLVIKGDTLSFSDKWLWSSTTSVVNVASGSAGYRSTTNKAKRMQDFGSRWKAWNMSIELPFLNFGLEQGRCILV